MSERYRIKLPELIDIDYMRNSIVVDEAGLKSLSLQIHNMLTKKVTEIDETIYGSSYVLQCTCGRNHRLPPDKIVIKSPGKAPGYMGDVNGPGSDPSTV